MPPQEHKTREQVQLVADHFEDRRSRNRSYEVCLTILAIALSSMVTVSGVMRWSPEVTGCLGAALSALLVADRFFVFGEKSSFYKTLSAEANNLLLDWDEATCDADRLDVRKRLKELRDLAGRATPRGESFGQLFPKQ